MQLSDIRAAIQALGYGSDTAAQQTSFINDAYRQVTSKLRWPFLEQQSVELTTTVGTNAYDLPSDMSSYRNIDAVRIGQDSSQNWMNLDYVEPQDFRDREHVDRGTGTPCNWTFINQQLHFWPIPDSVYTVTIDFITEPADLADDTDVPVIPAAYHDILVWGAIHAITFRERDWLGRSDADQQFQMRLQRMEEEFMIRQRQTASHVKKSGFWNTREPYPWTGLGW